MGIDNPFNVFKYLYTRDSSKSINFMCLINDEKYSLLEHTEKLELLVGTADGLKIKDVKIKNSNNPVQLKAAKLFTYTI